MTGESYRNLQDSLICRLTFSIMTASYISVVKLAIFISASSLVCCLPQSGKHDLTLQDDPPDQRYPQHVHLSLGGKIPYPMIID